MNGIGGDLSDELIAAILCEKMRWTYDQFLDNPNWFNALLLLKMGLEGEHNKKLTKK